MTVNPEFTLDSLLPKIKEWYNGFSWNGKDTVYNPFGLLVFFDDQRFVNSWFSTGTPTFLIKSIMDGRVLQFDNTKINLSNASFRSFKQLDTKVLMLQAGYLTLKSLDVNNDAVLDYPNNEVRDSMYCYLLDEIHGTNNVQTVPITDLAAAFRETNILKIERIIKHVFDDLPYDVYTHQTLKQTEGFFHGIVHILFNYLGVYAKSEVHTTEGRADSVVETDTHVFVFEFKINKTAAAALQQIKTNNYISKYRNLLATSGFGVKNIVSIGVNFNTENRLMDDFMIEIKIGHF